MQHEVTDKVNFMQPDLSNISRLKKERSIEKAVVAASDLPLLTRMPAQ